MFSVSQLGCLSLTASLLPYPMPWKHSKTDFCFDWIFVISAFEGGVLTNGPLWKSHPFRFLCVFMPLIYWYLLIALCLSLFFIITYITYFHLLTFSCYPLIIYSLSLLMKNQTKKSGSRRITPWVLQFYFVEICEYIYCMQFCKILKTYYSLIYETLCS